MSFDCMMRFLWVLFLVATRNRALAGLGASSAPYRDCSNIQLEEIGFNFVKFSGNLHKVRAVQIRRTEEGLVVDKPLFFRFANDIVGRHFFQTRSGIVPLLKSDGFELYKWYIVCGTSAPPDKKASDGCEVCGLVRFCDCRCDAIPVKYLRLSVGRVQVEDNWGSVGLLTAWQLNTVSSHPVRFTVETSMTWLPSPCDQTPDSVDCDRATQRFKMIQPPFAGPPINPERWEKQSLTSGGDSFGVDLEFRLDTAAVRQTFPTFNIQNSYTVKFPRTNFERDFYRNKTFDLLVPFDTKDMTATRRICQRIQSHVDGRSTPINFSPPQPYSTPSDTPSRCLNYFLFVSLICASICQLL